jgi:hypothetical protein
MYSKKFNKNYQKRLREYQFTNLVKLLFEKRRITEKNSRRNFSFNLRNAFFLSSIKRCFPFQFLGKISLCLYLVHTRISVGIPCFSLQEIVGFWKGEWKEILTLGFFNDLGFPYPMYFRTFVNSNFSQDLRRCYFCTFFAVSIFVNKIIFF